MARQQAYPWDKWLKRRQVTLKQGVDFRCQPHSMSVMIRRRALERKIDVSVFIDGKNISIVRH